MKTIYLVSRAKSTSGPINQALNILNGMRENGRVQTTLVTLEPEKAGYSWLQRFYDAKLPVHQFNQGVLPVLLCAPKLRKYVRENNIDVIHSSGFRANIVSILSGAKAKRVITQRCHPVEIAEKYPSYLKPIIGYFYMLLIKRMDAIVACSKSIQSIFKNEYGMDVFAVQNGVNTDFFKPSSESEKINLRRKLGLPEDKRIYLALGTLIARKNNKVAIEAFNRMKLDNSALVFVGEGNEDSMLKEMANGNPDIIFTGATKTPLDYLQACDILISCSLGEGLPNTVLEAMACGLPCILSDIGPHKELIEGSEAGIIFKRDSSNDLTLALSQSLVWNLKQKSELARKLAIENFSVPILAKKYEDVYRQTIKKAL